MKKKLYAGITMLFGGVAAVIAGYNNGSIEIMGGGIASVAVAVIILLEVAGVIKIQK